jgi:hypothetical protein
MRHNTGEVAQQRGVYHSNCRCRAETRIRRGDSFPLCGTCEKAVTWLFTRSPMSEESGPPAGPFRLE